MWLLICGVNKTINTIRYHSVFRSWHNFASAYNVTQRFRLNRQSLINEQLMIEVVTPLFLMQNVSTLLH